MSGEGTARDVASLLCRQEDSARYNIEGRLHKNMKKRCIARRDKVLIAVVQQFTKGRPSVLDTVISTVNEDVGRLEGLQKMCTQQGSACLCTARQVFAQQGS